MLHIPMSLITEIFWVKFIPYVWKKSFGLSSKATEESVNCLILLESWPVVSLLVGRAMVKFTIIRLCLGMNGTTTV